MSIKTSIGAAYRKLADHVGKVIAAIGGTLLALDIAGQGDMLKQQANEFLGAKGAQKLGLLLFILAFARFLYAGYKANQHQQQIAALQAQVDALTKNSKATENGAQAAPTTPPLPANS